MIRFSLGEKGDRQLFCYLKQKRKTPELGLLEIREGLVVGFEYVQDACELE
jgi:hypothetical protein